MSRITRGKSQPDLPAHMLLDKFARTRIYEDPDDLDNHARGTLRQTGSDAPLFQHEDQRRVDSRAMINIRTEGGRSAEVPDHSEEFIDVHSRDTRGPSNEPNWKAFNAQRRARGKKILTRIAVYLTFAVFALFVPWK